MNFATEEQKSLLENFHKKMSKNKDAPVLIYGLGINTKFLLENLKEYNIIGLMDAESVGKTYWGYKVYSLEEAEKEAKIIVIVARRIYQKIIFDRIKFLMDKGIEIFNLINFKFNNQKEVFNALEENAYWNNSKEDLKKYIDKFDVISFDIFDTLIMRKILRPVNIFDVVEYEARKEKINVNFKEKRVELEYKLKSELKVTTYDEIYDELALKCNLTSEIKNYLKDKEFEVELKFFTKRNDMVDLLNYAIDKKKKIYLTSDMYFSKKQIEIILNKMGINNYGEIIVSSEYRKTKESGELYFVLKDKAKTNSILHIGDNYEADIENAKRAGLSAYYIMNSYDLLLESKISHLLVKVSSFVDTLILGHFISVALNSPFGLGKNRGLISIPSLEKFGYLLYGPLIYTFFCWFFEQIKKDDSNLVLFAARDGYLIEKIFKLINSKEVKNKGLYFLASRRAISVPTIKNREDILRILKKTSINGKLGDILKVKFGVDPKNHDTKKEEHISSIADRYTLTKYILSYKKEIFDRSKYERNNYERYIFEKIKIKNKKIFLFDLVSSGTMPFYLEKLLNKEVILLSFATTNLPNLFFSEISNIKSFLGNYNSQEYNCAFLKYYILWECILTSPDGQLLYFDDKGKPVFAENQHTDFSKIKKIHNGIIKFLNDMLNIGIDFPYVEKSYIMADSLFEVIEKKYSIVDDEIKKNFVFDNLYEGIDSEKCWDNIIF